MNRLREAREQKGLSLSQVGGQVNKTAQAIWKYEHEVSGVPDKTKVALSELYGESVTFLFPELDGGKG